MYFIIKKIHEKIRITNIYFFRLILSRVGIHYLSSTFGSWTICQAHRKEFLDAWYVPIEFT